MDEAGLQIVATENTTGFRALACSSIYMASSTIMMFNSIGKMGVNPALLLNEYCTGVEILRTVIGRREKV